MADEEIKAAAESPGISSSAAAVCLSVLLAVGLWLRLSGLGERQFAQDEYYYIQSVRNILEFGLPKFPGGGYYFRGVLVQYLTAASALIFGDGYFAYRLPMALFGAGTLAAAYFLGRQFLSRAWSLVLVAILTVSCWQIEFAKFARMYAGLQFAAVCFFWSLYRYSFDGASAKRYIAVGFAALAILTSELGVFVAVLLFLPPAAWLQAGLRRTLSEQWGYLLLSAALTVIGYLMVVYPFRYIGVSNPLPPGYEFPDPKVPHWLSFGTGLFDDTLFFGVSALLVAALVGWYLIYVHAGGRRKGAEETLLGGLTVFAACAAVVYQLGMGALALLLVFLRDPRFLGRRPWNRILVVFGALAVFWSAMLFANSAWVDAAGLGGLVRTYFRAFRLAFFAFPDLYTPVVRAWADSLPVWGGILGLAIAVQAFGIRRAPWGEILRHPVTPIAVIVVCFGIKPPISHIVTRYSFFLYPIALCVVLLFFIQVGDILKRRSRVGARTANLLAAGLCLLAFGLGEDFYFYYLSHLNSDAVAFRTGRFQKFSSHWYPRPDFQRPAEFVNQAAAGGDRVIATANINAAAEYLKGERAMYWPRENAEFAIISREGGTRELWSGSRLLSTMEDVAEYGREAGRLWLLVAKRADAYRFDPHRLWPGRVEHVEVHAPGRDGRIEVWKVDLKPADGAV